MFFILFYFVVKIGDIFVIEMLLFKGVEVDLRNSNGLMLLLIVVVNDKWNVFKFFMERGLDLILENNNGWSVLYVVV